MILIIFASQKRKKIVYNLFEVYMGYLLLSNRIYSAESIFQNIWLIILIATLLIIGFIVFTWLRQRKVDADIDININTARIYYLDLAHNRITFFNRNAIKKRKSGNLDYFFSQFHPSERERIRKWLNQLLDENATPSSFIEADVIIKKNRDPKASFFSLLEVLSINKKEKRIYLESYLLRFLSPRIKSGKRVTNLFITEKRATEIYSHLKDNKKGTTMIVRFYKMSPRQKRNLRFERLLVANLKNRIIPFLGGNRLLVNYGDLELGIFDFKSSGGKSVFLPLARSIANDLARFLDVNGYHELYSFSIGIVDNSAFNKLPLIVKQAREMAIIAEEKEEDIVYFDANSNSDEFQLDKTFTKDLMTLIKEKKITIYYRAIVDAKTKSPLGYFSSVQPYNSIFNNFTELKEYALKNKLDQELFQMIAKNIIPRFFNQRDGDKLTLFLPVIVSDYQSIIKILPQVNHSRDVPITLLFEEEDIALEVDKTTDVIANFSDYNNKGYHTALVINDAQLMLPSELYQMFDYFVVGGDFTANIDSDERARMILNGTLGKLVRYEKPVIVCDLENWTDIELVVRSGIRLISSEEIGSNDEMVLPIDKKKMLRLDSLSK